MSYQSEVLADNPLLYLKQDESSGTTVIDSSGNSRNGTYSGSPVFGRPSLIVTDPSGKAVKYNGTEAAEHSFASYMNVTQLTCEAWVTPSTDSAVKTIGCRFAPSSALWQFQIYNRDVRATIGGNTAGTGNFTNAGTKYHCVMTHDGTNTKVYMDSVLKFTQNLGAVGTASGPFTWGANRTGASGAMFDFMYGDMDELAFYGTALSQARVTAHYNAALFNTNVGSLADMIQQNMATAGSNSKREFDFWSGLSGLTPVAKYSLADHMKAALVILGYTTGSNTDRLQAYLTAQSISYPARASLNDKWRYYASTT